MTGQLIDFGLYSMMFLSPHNMRQAFHTFVEERPIFIGSLPPSFFHLSAVLRSQVREASLLES